MARHAGGRRRAGVSRPRRLAGLSGAAQSDWVFGVGPVRRDAGQLRQGPARRRQGDLTIAITIARDSARLRRGRRPGSLACTPEEREFRRCGWTWIGLPAVAREAALRPPNAPRRGRPLPPAGATRPGSGGGRCSGDEEMVRRDGANSLGAQPASARSRLGPPLGGDREGDRNGYSRAGCVGIGGREREARRGGVVARRGAGMLTAGRERPAATTGNEAKLVYGGRGAGGPATAFRWMRDRGSWIPSWTRRNAGRFRPLSEFWR